MKNYQMIQADNENIKSAFIIIKPGFLNLSEKILNIFKEHDWTIKKIRTTKLTLAQAHELYKPHKKEEWYKPLCFYMSNGLSTGIILQKRFEKNTSKQDAFNEISELKEEIRKQWTESDMRNVIHSSDNEDRFNIESGIYF